MPIFDLCETAGFLRVLLLLKYFFRAVCIITPILLMIPITIQLIKCVISGNQDDLKALIPTAAKKLVLALLIFFVPTIVIIANISHSVVIMLYSAIIADILSFITAIILLKLEFKKVNKNIAINNQ